MRKISMAVPVAGAAMALTVAAAVPALAAGSGAQGTWRVVDHGQGCWGGGPLNGDGTAGGSGGCSLSVPGVGHEVASVVPGTWAFTDASDTAVTLCVDIVVKSGPPLISGQLCFPVPVTSGAPAVIPELSADTYGKVVLAG